MKEVVLRKKTIGHHWLLAESEKYYLGLDTFHWSREEIVGGVLSALNLNAHIMSYHCCVIIEGGAWNEPVFDLVLIVQPRNERCFVTQ
jgi:hypothetical protein